MLSRLLMIVFAICVFTQVTSITDAKEGPAAGREPRLLLIDTAPTCQEAARLFRLCAIGATLDGELALSVEKVCKRSFLAQLLGKVREAYQAAIDA
jgi:hypothetical protein